MNRSNPIGGELKPTIGGGKRRRDGMGELELLTQSEVAKYLKISTKTLEAMRQKGNGPVFHKFGRRVLYKKATLNEYLDKHSFGSTSEYQ